MYGILKKQLHYCGGTNMQPLKQLKQNTYHWHQRFRFQLRCEIILIKWFCLEGQYDWENAQKQSAPAYSPPSLVCHAWILHIKLPPILFFPQCRLSVHRRRGLNDKHAPGLLTDSSAVICMSKATCCRSERGYPARIPGIPIPNGKLAFRVLVGSFLMRFRSGPGFSVTREERSKVNIAACAKSCMIIHTQTHTNLIYWSMWSGRVTGALLVLQQ